MSASWSEPVWATTDHLIEGASLSGILAHKLGPLAANRLRRLDQPLPKPLVGEERAASLAMLSAIPLLHRIRNGCEGPLLLLKGPEIGALYPRNGRRFGDIDILTPDAEEVQRSLLTRGFELGEPDFDMSDGLHHHLPPICWPTIPLNIEVHSSPNWPPRAQQPPLAEIIEAAVPSVLGVEGIGAPSRLHHTLIFAAHAWRHEPLFVLRDLVDVAVLSQGIEAGELDRLASRWGIARLWATTKGAVDALFYGGRRTMPLRSWARHLELVRERTVLENHLQRWLHPFWELPPAAALGQTAHVLRTEVAPVEGEPWSRKVTRSVGALRNPSAPAKRPAVAPPAAAQTPAAGPQDVEPAQDDDPADREAGSR